MQTQVTTQRDVTASELLRLHEEYQDLADLVNNLHADGQGVPKTHMPRSSRPNVAEADGPPLSQGHSPHRVGVHTYIRTCMHACMHPYKHRD